MDKFQEQLMINNLESNDISDLSLETILSYVEAINTANLPDSTKEQYIALIRHVMLSVRRSPKDSVLIAKIACGLHMHNKYNG